MVRAEALPFDNFTRATWGQLSYVWLNQAIDYQEKRARVHDRCRPKFDTATCEVCYEPLYGEGISEPGQLVAEGISDDEIYRPGETDVQWDEDDEAELERERLEFERNKRKGEIE